MRHINDATVSIPLIADNTNMLLQLSGVCKSYGGVLGLDHVNLSIHFNERVALVGDNGAGKSTMVKVICGAITPDSGVIKFKNIERRFRGTSEARAAGIETVFQDLALIEQAGIAENMFLGREELSVRAGLLSVLASKKMRQRSEEMLGEVGIKVQNIKSAVHNLSGGQRQGIAIARAVGWGSSLVIMDEPTASLGVRETLQVESQIESLRERGMAVFIVSHDLRQVFALADRIVVLRRGRIVGIRRPSETSQEEVVQLITGVTQDADTGQNNS